MLQIARAAGAPRYRLWLVLAVLLGQLACVVTPRIHRALGIEDLGMWFLDSYAILAASDAAQAGYDPYVAMPDDPLGRLHSYSTWWLQLGRFGITHEDNFLFGGACVAVFFGLLFAWLRPASGGETVWLAAIGLSPPMLLLINRANNDLVVFILLLAAFGWMRAPTWTRIVMAVLAVALATGLKFYPVAAIAAFLLVRPSRRMLVALVLGGVVAGGAFLAIRDDFARASFPEAFPLCTFGAEVFFHEFGWNARQAGAVALVVLTASAALAVRRGWTTGLDNEASGSLDRRLMFVAGSILLLGCFAARVSYSYRWVLVLGAVPWLWRRATDAVRPDRVARFAVGLLVVVVWMDGLYCFIGNSLFGPFTKAQAMQWTHVWRLATQPLVWVLMALLAGWLLDLLLSVWRRTRNELVAPAAPKGPVADG